MYNLINVFFKLIHVWIKFAQIFAQNMAILNFCSNEIKLD